MARPGKNRNPAAKAIAAQLPALLSATKGGNEFDKEAITDAAFAVQFFAPSDILEHSRFQVYARGMLMERAAMRGRFSVPLSLYAKALIAWSEESAYEKAVSLAVDSVAAAKAQCKVIAAKQAA